MLAARGVTGSSCLTRSVVYQFFDSSAGAIHGVGWRFPIIGVLNAIFVHVYVTEHYVSTPSGRGRIPPLAFRTELTMAPS